MVLSMARKIAGSLCQACRDVLELAHAVGGHDWTTGDIPRHEIDQAWIGA